MDDEDTKNVTYRVKRMSRCGGYGICRTFKDEEVANSPIDE